MKLQNWFYLSLISLLCACGQEKNETPQAVTPPTEAEKQAEEVVRYDLGHQLVSTIGKTYQVKMSIKSNLIKTLNLFSHQMNDAEIEGEYTIIELPESHRDRMVTEVCFSKIICRVNGHLIDHSAYLGKRIKINKERNKAAVVSTDGEVTKLFSACLAQFTLLDATYEDFFTASMLRNQVAVGDQWLAKGPLLLKWFEDTRDKNNTLKSPPFIKCKLVNVQKVGGVDFYKLAIEGLLHATNVKCDVGTLSNRVEIEPGSYLFFNPMDPSSMTYENHAKIFSEYDGAGQKYNHYTTSTIQTKCEVKLLTPQKN